MKLRAYKGTIMVLMMLCLSCKSEKHTLVVKDGMVLIPSGVLTMGGNSEQADPDEYPNHDVKIASFWMDETEVTNEQFKQFVDATGFTTVAEREIDWEEMKKQLPPGTPKP